MKLLKSLLLACAILYVAPVLANSIVTAVPNGVKLDLDSLQQTFVFDGEQVQTISVTYAGNTYTQTFTYSGGEVSVISAWILQE